MVVGFLTGALVEGDLDGLACGARVGLATGAGVSLATGAGVGMATGAGIVGGLSVGGGRCVGEGVFGLGLFDGDGVGLLEVGSTNVGRLVGRGVGLPSSSVTLIPDTSPSEVTT